jgi:hypothetical protein
MVFFGLIPVYLFGVEGYLHGVREIHALLDKNCYYWEGLSMWYATVYPDTHLKGIKSEALFHTRAEAEVWVKKIKREYVDCSDIRLIERGWAWVISVRVKIVMVMCVVWALMMNSMPKMVCVMLVHVVSGQRCRLKATATGHTQTK